MKTRSGFVSNSSSSSFCIYGWKRDTYEEMEKLMMGIRRNTSKLNTLLCQTEDGSYVGGVGYCAGEMDHYDVDWQDYECEPPRIVDQRELEKVAEKHGLTKPEMFSATWWD